MKWTFLNLIITINISTYCIREKSSFATKRKTLFIGIKKDIKEKLSLLA